MDHGLTQKERQCQSEKTLTSGMKFFKHQGIDKFMIQAPMSPFIPRYVRTAQTGVLKEKIRQAEALLSPCILCPRQCRVDRARDEKGYCGAGEKAMVASFAPHFGEEAPLVGDRGSGAFFFSHCNLKCVFCQNYEISIDGRGQAMEAEEVAYVMLYLQNMGCCNINLVTPTHVVPRILKALDMG